MKNIGKILSGDRGKIIDSGNAQGFGIGINNSTIGIKKKNGVFDGIKGGYPLVAYSYRLLFAPPLHNGRTEG